MQNNLKTAFILSIIANASSEAFSYLALFVFPNHFSIVGNLWAALFIMPNLVAPIVLGSISLSLIKNIGDIKGGKKVMYTFTRILSIVAIVVGAILSTIGLFAFGTSISFNYQ